MDRLIYQIKGGMKKKTGRYLAGGIFLIVVAICYFWLSGLEQEGASVRIGKTMGSIGGGPMFSEEGQNLLKIVGFLCVLVGLYGIEKMIQDAMCWLKVFSDHIEFQPRGLLIRKETVSIMVGQISSVSYSIPNGCVKILSGGRNYQIACPKPEEAFQKIDAIKMGIIVQKKVRLSPFVSSVFQSTFLAVHISVISVKEH